jgi:hypothetical protein
VLSQMLNYNTSRGCSFSCSEWTARAEEGGEE